MDTQMKYMSLAIDTARRAAQTGEVPVGAIIVDASGAILAQSGNRVECDFDPTAHAEIIALRMAAAVRKTTRLADCDLYVTLEPCPMCAAALAHARIRRIYFGAYDPKGGGIDHGPRIFTQPTCHHRPEIYGGISEDDCARLLRDFFKLLR